jgi:hypothetical protein
MSSGEGAEYLAQGDGGRSKGLESVGGKTVALEEAVVACVGCRRKRGGTRARVVVVGSRPEPKGVVGREGVTGGKLDGGGEEAAVASGQDAADEWRRPIPIGGSAGLGGGVGRRGILGEPLRIHFSPPVGRRW